MQQFASGYKTGRTEDACLIRIRRLSNSVGITGNMVVPAVYICIAGNAQADNVPILAKQRCW